MKSKATELEPNTLVWAKLTGYPYWPGRITPPEITNKLKRFYSNNKNSVGVLFFGTELSYSLVNKNKIRIFEKNENYKNLDEEIKIAFEQAKISNEIEYPEITPPTLITIKNFKEDYLRENYSEEKLVKENIVNKNCANENNFEGFSLKVMIKIKVGSKIESEIAKKLNKIIKTYPDETKNVNKIMRKIKYFTIKEIKAHKIFNLLSMIQKMKMTVDPLNLQKKVNSIIKKLKNKIVK